MCFFTNSISFLHVLVSSECYPISIYILYFITQRIHRSQGLEKLVTPAWVPVTLVLAGTKERMGLEETARFIPPPVLGLPFLDIFPHTRKHIQNFCQERWNTDTKQSKPRELNPKTGGQLSSNSGCRRREVILFRLRIGHTYATQLFRLTRGDPPSARGAETSGLVVLPVDCADFEIERV